MADRADLPASVSTAEPTLLRVAVVVESLVVPEWVAWTVGRIDSMETCELTAIVSVRPEGGGSQPPRPALAYRLYERLDARVFGPPTAMRAVDLQATALCRGTEPPLEPLDVVVSFLPADRIAWDGPPPRYGVWAISPADAGRPGEGLGQFWDVCTGGDTSATAIVATADGRQEVLARASARADPLSVTRTRNAAAWAAARLVVRTLRTVSRMRSPVPTHEPHDENAHAPSTRVIVNHALRTAARGLTAKSRKVWAQDEWFVALRQRTADGHVRGPVRAVPNPTDRYLADPFPIEVEGRHYIFVEDYSLAESRGVISVLEPGADDAWSPARPVLQRDHHLSYPFVFEQEGTMYMLPETGEAGRVELYRALNFPRVWQLDRVLLDGIVAVDATLHNQDGLLWLFAHVIEGRGDFGELWLYSSPSLDLPWHPHPANPIVSNPGSARPAGRLFRRHGALIRPSQDCSHRYGEAIVLNRVEVLSPTAYCERPVGRIEADWMPGLAGTHTYTFDSRYECFDAIRNARRLRWPRR